MSQNDAVDKGSMLAQLHDENKRLQNVIAKQTLRLRVADGDQWAG